MPEGKYLEYCTKYLPRVELHKHEKTGKLSALLDGHGGVGFDSCATGLFYSWFLSSSTVDRPAVSILDLSSKDFPDALPI